MQTPHQTAYSLLRFGHAAPVEIAAGVQRLEQHLGDALDLSGRSERRLLRLPRTFRVANEFVEANSHRLTQVHGNILFAGGDADQPVTVTQIVIREAELFRTEQERDAARRQPLADQARATFE